MTSGRQPVRAADFYSQTVLPVLIARLDQVFPEFGWRRDRQGWVATNEEFTHARLGVRAERVVAHGEVPRGFLVHGGESMLWTAYVGDGHVPHGQDFIRAVEELARRAGIDPEPITSAGPRDRRSELLREFFELCQHEFLSERGAEARSYLERRGFPVDAIETTGLGLVPQRHHTRQQLNQARYQDAELAAAGILADSRWPGRLCGAWTDDYGRIGTFWARALQDDEAPGTRYLYLRGASRSNLPPYGLAGSSHEHGQQRDLVIVEGFLDYHQLRARGIEDVAALGGTSTSPKTFEHLHRLGIDAATLCFDNDDAGRSATARAVENAARARSSPDVYVIDPRGLAAAKDPDELVRERGVDGWDALIQSRTCGIAWRANELVRDVGRDSPAGERRAALARAGRWLGSLQPRLALEQEDALRGVAKQCGHSVEAVERAFRARFYHGRTVERSRSVPGQGGRQQERVLER
jgi:DNA primase